VGTFNGWDRAANPMTPDGSGHWSASTLIAPGVYQYLFVVDSKRWVPDSAAPHVLDANGNTNSLLVVPPADYTNRPGKVGDGIITLSAIRHTGGREDVLRKNRNTFALSLRTRHNDVARCIALIAEDAHGPARSFPMHIARSNALYDTWRVQAPVSGDMLYAFELEDGAYRISYGKDGAASHVPRTSWFRFDPARFPALITPQWPRSAVFYQIFPDRFANGDQSNDPPGTLPWGSTRARRNRMGGDLTGVLQHFRYLEELGINAIYFNPLFVSESYHGYDTTDYYHIDPRFGTDQQLADLTARAHSLGWHVILDGVFNHTSVKFPAFEDLETRGAASPYLNWYYVKSLPLQVREGQSTYVGWAGVYGMPKLRVDNPAVRADLLGAVKKWMQFAGIDGWRLDTADELTHSLWQAFRRTVKKQNPEAYIVGEIWKDASAWLQGNELDSVMNYPWREAALQFFASDRISPTEFDKRLSDLRSAYPDEADAVMFNILGSHDTPRLLTLCGGDRNRQLQAALFQLTYPGTPCIYYGDEIGMTGSYDPDCRKCMEWNPKRWDRATLSFYKAAIALRRSSPALTTGSYRTVLADDKRQLFGYLRSEGTQRIIVLFNRGAAPVRLPLSAIRGVADLGKTLISNGAHTQGGYVDLEAHGAIALGK
ncbi:MAG TPA: alpha amylase N-terminal ig-like domain-containing protein, partial [Chthonomonadales bacterium]|nr:alpha amylase N-terminal ig-like domain-containing protein [Chthonomonadales bacterium]